MHKIIIGFCFLFIYVPFITSSQINREDIVRRHEVTISAADALSSLSVGNGKFAYTVDFTGLQSFPEFYDKGIPLGTQSEWGWHSFPNDSNYTFEESLVEYDFHGRKIPYNVQANNTFREKEAVTYLRQNQHRLHLGIVGLDIFHKDGSKVNITEINEINETLDPWSGEIHCTFKIDGEQIEVITYAHQKLDLISAKIVSPLIENGRIKIKINFPYPTGGHTDSGCDWNQPEKHISKLKANSNSAIINRQIDSTYYFVSLNWKGNAKITEQKKHHFYLEPEEGQNEISFSFCFTPERTISELPEFNETASNSINSWKNFWTSGGFIDFSGSTDPRAFELERRVVLSQYLTKVQCSGNYPPQETGLTFNSWHGKFHLEMHWWHAVHFALWGRVELMEQSLDWYKTVEENARTTAIRQGFDGIRWPKMTDPNGMDSPSNIGSFLIWQQPHYIYFAELLYRSSPNSKTLQKYADLMFKTADFMASYAWYDSLSNRYILGPALIPAQERFPAKTTINPPFELAYWYWGLKTAQQWRQRINLEKNEKWDDILEKFSRLAEKDGLYLAAESAPDSYSNPELMSDHPMVLGAFGILPHSRLLELPVMKNTFESIWNNWNWEETWGWDFPMVAMAATRLGMPEKAIDALFMDVETNKWLPNGHNYQNSSLTIYLPGNGSLLTAVAIMCAGFDGSNSNLPGFPKDGSWIVKWEGLQKMP